MPEQKPEPVATTSGAGALRPGTVQVTVKEGITGKNLHAVLDRIIQIHGCSHCGLAGLDIRLRVRDEVLAEKFSNIEGVQDVTIVRG